MKHSIIMISYLSEYPNCAKNRTKKFIRAVDSFEANSYNDKELIIVSDGCPKTNFIYNARYAKNKEIKLIIAPKQEPGYPGALRTLGLFLARGETSSYLDTDDYLSSNFIASAVSQFNQDCIWGYYDPYTADIKREFRKLPSIKEDDAPEDIRKFRWTILPAKIRKSVIGTPSLIHNTNAREQCFWKNWSGKGGNSEDWEFIEQLIALNPNPEKLPTNPGYYLCHFRAGGVDV